MEPIAFLSYSHFDDNHHGGLILSLFRRISDEVQAQTGKPFHIFVDRKNILWGQAWKDAIKETLDSVAILFPVLTPSYFASEECLNEAGQFIDRKNSNGKFVVILPIILIGVDVGTLDAEAAKLAKALLAIEFLDWRPMRHEPIATRPVRKRIAEVAEDIRKIVVGFKKTTNKTNQSEPLAEKRFVSEGKPKEIGKEDSPKPITYRKPEILLVDKGGGADFTSINAALDKVSPGARIVVLPGVYEEHLMLTRPVEIVGHSEGEKKVVVTAAYGATIRISSSMALVSNLHIVSSWKGEALYISGGRVQVYACDITSKDDGGIIILNGASPIIQDCKIHDCGEGGIVFQRGARGILEDCEIWNTTLAGIFIANESDPVIRRNSIHHGKQSGIYVYENGRGRIEANDIYSNAHAGIAISHGGNPYAVENKIAGSGEYGGVYVFKRGRGTFERNDLSGNQKGGFQITEKCFPHVKLDGNFDSSGLLTR